MKLASDVGLHDLPDVPSLSLGTGLVTPLELTAAFAAFPNGGLAVRPRGILSVTDADGVTVFEWSKGVWIGVFGTATFLFWHLLLNQNDAYLDALRQTRVAVALGLVLAYGAVTVGTWLFFKVRNAGGSLAEPA